MTSTISFNPYSVSTPQSSFVSETQGYYQGVALDDPSSRMWLMGGFLASSDSLTMWGGVPVNELINVMGTAAEGVGPSIARATSQATTTGFSVFDQAGSMVITASSKVPQAGSLNYVSFYRVGTNAVRIVTAVDPALVAALVSSDGNIGSQSLYWDVTNYRVTLTTSGGNFALPTSVRLLSVQTNSQIVTYASSAASWSAGDACVLLI